MNDFNTLIVCCLKQAVKQAHALQIKDAYWCASSLALSQSRESSSDTIQQRQNIINNH